MRGGAELRSFGKRLTWIMISSSGLLLLLACMVLVLVDRAMTRQDIVGDLTTAGSIVGANSVAPLVFQDPSTAAETLQSVRDETSILAAVLYDAKGRIFAQYHRDGAESFAPPPAPAPEGHSFVSDHLVLWRTIMLDGKVIGTLYFDSDLGPLAVRLRGQLAVMGIVVSVAILLSFVLSYQLGQVVSKPINRMAGVAAEIGGGHHELRVPVESSDELGSLARSFNRMLDDLSATTISRDSVDNIIRSMAESLVVLSPEGTIQTVNQATSRMLGYAEDELVGQRFDVVMAEGLDMMRLEGQGAIVNVDRLYRTKLGGEVPVSFSASLLQREGRGVQGVVCVAQDTREQRRVLREVRQRERQHAALADLWRLTLSRSDPSRLMNEVTERMLTVLEVDLTALMEIVPEKGHLVLQAGCGWGEGMVGRETLDAGPMSIAALALLDDGPVVVKDINLESRFDVQPLLRDHQVASCMAVVVHGIRSPYGVLSAFSCSRREFTRDDIHFLEVAAQVLAEAIARSQAEQSRERFVTILEAASDFVGIARWDGGIIYLNQAGRRMIGAGDEEDVSQLSVRDLHPPWANEINDAQALPTVAREGRWRGELALLTRDGREIPVSSAMQVHKAPDGGVRFVSFIMRDVTEHKLAEETLRAATEAALEASRAKSEFLANMSHEIRTPMNGIIGMTELALDTQLSQDQRECLETVRTSADSLLGVINDILDFSKIEAGRLDLEVIPFRLHECLRDMLKALSARAHQKGLDLVCEIEPGLPQEVMGDPGRLRQVLTNLIGNAIKFTAKGEVVLRAGAEEIGEGAVSLQFQVADTGIGIARDKQKVIFEPFSQADGSTTRRYGGTGLGLSISSQLVEMMGGRIWVDSEVDKGSVFHVVVEAKVVSHPQEAPQAARTANLGGVRVLIVDDNASSRRVLAALTSGWGMRSVVMEDGPSGLVELQEGARSGDPYRLALVDFQMPGMDGFTLCERARQDASLASTSMILLTSAGFRGDAARCRELGVRAYLIKPVIGQELLECIQTVLGTSGAAPEPGSPQLASPQPLTRHSLRETRRRLHILLAEDNPINQAVATRMIEKQGHTVVTAKDGKEALELLERDSFDVVLMDVQMPIMDGLEATAQIRAREALTGAHQKIIALTAHAMKGDRERCLDAGMDDYLSKPLKSELLFATIDRMLPDSPAVPESAPQARQAPQAHEGLLACASGDADLTVKLARMFVAQAPVLMEQLRLTLERDDAQGLEHASHKLKGSLQTIGADEAARIAGEVERLARERSLGEAGRPIAALEEQMGGLIRSLLTMTGEMAGQDGMVIP